jgi:hypothetical protein
MRISRSRIVHPRGVQDEKACTTSAHPTAVGPRLGDDSTMPPRIENSFQTLEINLQWEEGLG